MSMSIEEFEDRACSTCLMLDLRRDRRFDCEFVESEMVLFGRY